MYSEKLFLKNECKIETGEIGTFFRKNKQIFITRRTSLNKTTSRRYTSGRKIMIPEERTEDEMVSKEISKYVEIPNIV